MEKTSNTKTEGVEGQIGWLKVAKNALSVHGISGTISEVLERCGGGIHVLRVEEIPSFRVLLVIFSRGHFEDSPGKCAPATFIPFSGWRSEWNLGDPLLEEMQWGLSLVTDQNNTDDVLERLSVITLRKLLNKSKAEPADPPSDPKIEGE